MPNHFEYFRILLKKQFPKIGGLFDTLLYRRQGFSKVPHNTPFLQPCHSGGLHWSLLSNLHVRESERHFKVSLYDSLINFELGSKNQCVISSAIEWQACQLLLSRDSDASFNIHYNFDLFLQSDNSE